jgi:hypothetical protein
MIEHYAGLRLRTYMMCVAGLLFFAVSPCLRSQDIQGGQPPKSRQPASAPDFSGVWTLKEFSMTFSPKEQPPLQDWAQQEFASLIKRPKTEVDPTITQCFPPGMPRIMITPEPFEIFYLSNRVMMFFEYDHFVRQIYMDGRRHLEGLEPTWMGDSIGKWDGDTLVVDTVSLNDKTWLDLLGTPHSDALHITERIRRIDHDTLQIDFTFEDSKAFTHSWTSRKIFRLRPDWDIMERVCQDNFLHTPSPTSTK